MASLRRRDCVISLVLLGAYPLIPAILMRVAVSSQRHDTVVPKSALRRRNTGLLLPAPATPVEELLGSRAQELPRLEESSPQHVEQSRSGPRIPRTELQALDCRQLTVVLSDRLTFLSTYCL